MRRNKGLKFAITNVVSRGQKALEVLLGLSLIQEQANLKYWPFTWELSGCIVRWALVKVTALSHSFFCWKCTLAGSSWAAVSATDLCSFQVWCLILLHCSSELPFRITVPSSAAQKRSNVPYQMLLLLEKMQCGKCKAVCPRDLAYCLSEHRVKCKQPYLVPTSVCIIQHLQAAQVPTPPSGIQECQELGAQWHSALCSWVQCCVLFVKRERKNPAGYICWYPEGGNTIRLLEDSAVDTGQEKGLCRAQRIVHCLICLAALASW